MLEDGLLSGADVETPPRSMGRHSEPNRGGGKFGYSGLKAKNHATTVWYDELQPPTTAMVDDDYQRMVDMEAERKLTGLRSRFRDMENAFTPHLFTKEERKRMDGYESIDYWEPRHLLHAEYLAGSTRKKHTRYLKWVIFVAIGVSVGFWAVLLFQTIDWLSEKKLEVLTDVMQSQSINDASSSSSSSLMSSLSGGVSGSSSATTSTSGGLVDAGSIAKGYIVFILWSCGAAIVSSLCCVLMPSAAGSGIPDVMAYLNGIMFPRVFNLRTLFVKTLSCILAISSGLPVGAEGPIIHIGALIGAGLPTGRSRTLGRKGASDATFLSQFRNTKDHRDFISGGAAAGVTGAFGSPIGGLLFVMEEIATFFPAKLGWMVFFSCLSCVTVMHFFNSFFTGWELRNRSNLGFGNFVDAATVLFETQGAPGVVPMNLFSLLPSVIAGIFFGFLAVGFTLMNIKVARWRGRVINRSALRRVMEPCTVIFFYGTLCFFLPLAFDCRPIPPSLAREELQEIRLMKAFCANPETEYNPMATMTLTSSYNTIRLLYTRKTGILIPWQALLTYQALFTIGASYSGGMFLSSGMVIPTLLVGAIGGRFIGQVMGQSWTDAGLTALIGSAAFFGGLSRLTFSLIVIMLEISNDLTHIMCLMVAVIVARSIANQFCHSLYHLQLEVKCAPFLDDAVQQLHRLDTNCAADVMSKPVVCFKTTEKILTILEILTTSQHSAFPVVSVSDGSTYRGMIQRNTLEELLWYIKLRPGGNTSTTPHACFEDLQRVKEHQFWHRVEGTIPEDLGQNVTFMNLDLNPYLDPSAYFIHEQMCISRTFNMFRQLGLRQFPVLDRHNRVVGIITRKNLIGDRLNDAIAAANSAMTASGWTTTADRYQSPTKRRPDGTSYDDNSNNDVENTPTSSSRSKSPKKQKPRSTTMEDEEVEGRESSTSPTSAAKEPLVVARGKKGKKSPPPSYGGVES